MHIPPKVCLYRAANGPSPRPRPLLQIISAHPPVLCYSVPERLEPFWSYLTELGVPDVKVTVLRQPSLLGLEVDGNLRKMVEYLASVDTPPETIVKYLVTSL